MSYFQGATYLLSVSRAVYPKFNNSPTNSDKLTDWHAVACWFNLHIKKMEAIFYEFWRKEKKGTKKVEQQMADRFGQSGPSVYCKSEHRVQTTVTTHNILKQVYYTQ